MVKRLNFISVTETTLSQALRKTSTEMNNEFFYQSKLETCCVTA